MEPGMLFLWSWEKMMTMMSSMVRSGLKAVDVIDWFELVEEGLWKLPFSCCRCKFSLSTLSYLIISFKILIKKLVKYNKKGKQGDYKVLIFQIFIGEKLLVKKFCFKKMSSRSFPCFRVF